MNYERGMMNWKAFNSAFIVQHSSFGSASAATQAAARAEEAFVVAHDELRLDLRDGIHGDADQNQERRAAEVELVAHAVRNPPEPRRAGDELLDAPADERQPPDVE